MYAAFSATPGTSIVTARQIIYATAMVLLPALLSVFCKQGSEKKAKKESISLRRIRLIRKQSDLLSY